MKFDVAAEELREKTGLWSFSDLVGAGASRAAGWVATPWAAWECRLNIIPQLGGSYGVVKVDSSPATRVGGEEEPCQELVVCLVTFFTDINNYV